MNNNPTPDQTEIRELLISFRNGTINPDPKLWAFDVEKDLELALAAISKLMVLERIDELEQMRAAGIMGANKLNLYEYAKERLAKLRKGI